MWTHTHTHTRAHTPHTHNTHTHTLTHSELAQSIVSNATALEDELMLLSAQQVAAETVANDTQQLVEQAEEATGEVHTHTLFTVVSWL